MKKLEYSIAIDAPARKVWDCMLQLENYKIWVAASWPGSSYEGEWKEGSEIRFVGSDGSGTLAHMEEVKEYNTIRAVHTAVLLKGGVKDTSSPLAANWVNTKESYFFTESDGRTTLNVEIETKPEYEKMFDDGWPAALAKLKEICEAKS